MSQIIFQTITTGVLFTEFPLNCFDTWIKGARNFVMIETKQCSMCGETKQLCMFYKETQAKHNRQGYCKACNNEYRKKYNAKRKDATKPFVYQLFWHQNNAVYFGSSSQWFKRRIAHHLWHMKNSQHQNKNVQDQYNLFGPPEASLVGEYSTIKEAQDMEEFCTVSAISIPYIVVLNIGAGTKSHKRKLSKKEVFDIYESDEPSYVVGNKYGLSGSTIRMVRNGKTYREFYDQYHSNVYNNNVKT